MHFVLFLLANEKGIKMQQRKGEKKAQIKKVLCR